jgi:hypothetical protein
MRTRTPHVRRTLAVLIVAVLLGLGASGTAMAALPANDELANATQIDSLPFSDSVDTTDATQRDGEGGCGPPTHTVWYKIALPRDATLSIHVRASGFNNPSVSLWSNGVPPSASVICGGPEGDLTYRAQAGQTYYLQVGTRFFWEPGGHVVVNVEEIAAPANDGFAASTVFSQLPFSDTGNLNAATVEPNEPRPSPYYPLTASVWYRYVPQASSTVVVGGTGIAVAAYSGSQFSNLQQLGFQELAYGVPLAVRATAGAAIYFQVIPQFGGAGGPFTFTVDAAPAPIAQFSSTPDPSIFDLVQFFDGSYDPVGIGITSWSWSFGDGATSNSCCPTHRYLADGEYTVQETVTTQDGRRASASHTVDVRTHDVAIVQIEIPGSSKVGKTALITVRVSNSRYPELMELRLLKSVAGAGFQDIAATTMQLPVRKGKQATEIVFSYTFTRDDATLGKVSFEAVANLIAARDAAPADNTMISAPTRVS